VHSLNAPCLYIKNWPEGGSLDPKHVANYVLIDYICIVWGTAVAQWLRYCATNQKVTGSIPDGVMEFFIDINPLIALWSWGRLSVLTDMSTGSISWGEMRPVHKADNLTTVLCHCQEIWEL
jgi:hypothetical protein